MGDKDKVFERKIGRKIAEQKQEQKKNILSENSFDRRNFTTPLSEMRNKIGSISELRICCHYE